MRILGDLDFEGRGRLIRPSLNTTEFPTNPLNGELVLKDRRIYNCVEIVQGVPFWVPLTNEVNAYRHDQVEAAKDWTINHGFNANLVLVQVYNAQGQQVIPDIINTVQLNQALVSFATPMSGMALVMLGDTLGLPKANVAYTANYSQASTWIVTHGLGYHPSVTCIVDDYVVQPLSLVHDSLMQLTVTFTSAQTGSVRCV